MTKPTRPVLRWFGGKWRLAPWIIQHFPPQVSSCGTDLEFLVNTFPISQALPKIFAGSGDCALVKWRLVGLSVAEWALVWFVLILAFTGWFAFRRRAR